MEVHLDSDPGLERPLLVVAFPTTGLVGVVAAHVLIRKLNLPLVGSVRSHRLAPTVLVRNGEWTPPVSIHAKRMKCGIDGSCDGIYLVSGHVALDRELYWDMARELGDFFANKKTDVTILVRSQVGDERQGPPRVASVANGERAHAYASALAAPPLQDGLVRGVSGAWLLDGQRRGSDVLVLIAESRRGHRDHVAAVQVINMLERVLGPFPAAVVGDDAVQIEEEILRSERVTVLTEQRARDNVTRMYH